MVGAALLVTYRDRHADRLPHRRDVARVTRRHDVLDPAEVEVLEHADVLHRVLRSLEDPVRVQSKPELLAESAHGFEAFNSLLPLRGHGQLEAAPPFVEQRAHLLVELPQRHARRVSDDRGAELAPLPSAEKRLDRLLRALRGEVPRRDVDERDRSMPDSAREDRVVAPGGRVEQLPGRLAAEPT